MSTDKDKPKEARTEMEWLANIDEFLSETDHLSREEIKEALKDEGIDPNELIKRGMMFVEEQRRLAIQRLLEEAKHKNKDVIEGIAHTQSQTGTLEELRAKVKAMWDTFAGQGTSQLVLAFRNFETATEHDLQSLLADMESLRRLSDSEKEMKR